MSEISSLGLGLMGFALARCLVTEGHPGTVGERSNARAEAKVI
jgi:3-hydroxyisobutyrate dehydrogenase-like beta-hydroxyacid dehydrogenase